MMSTERNIPRRRALCIVAAAAGAPLIASGVRAASAQFHIWKGDALGAESRLALWHADAAKARRMMQHSLSEIARLESIFSLFDDDSEIARLNRDGALQSPSADLRLVLAESRRISELSGGAFDVTVQPLWRAYADHFANRPNAARGPEAGELDAVRALVDYRGLELGAGRIAFARPGMAVTLNGVAQGYITDRIADMLRDAGFEHVVVDLGEIRALGDHPEGRPWRIGLKDAQAPDQLADMVDIVNQAVATSGGYGTRFDASGRNHHIFDPATGQSAQRYASVTVIGPRASIADALATGIYVAPEARAQVMVEAFAGVRALITRADGSVREITV